MQKSIVWIYQTPRLPHSDSIFVAKVRYQIFDRPSEWSVGKGGVAVGSFHSTFVCALLACLTNWNKQSSKPFFKHTFYYLSNIPLSRPYRAKPRNSYSAYVRTFLPCRTHSLLTFINQNIHAYVQSSACYAPSQHIQKRPGLLSTKSQRLLAATRSATVYKQFRLAQ